jgi:hypothetical protein
MSKKALKIFGVLFMVLGFAAELGSGYISEKQMETEIEEKINEKLGFKQVNSNTKKS